MVWFIVLVGQPAVLTGQILMPSALARRINIPASLGRFVLILLVGGGIFSLCERNAEVAHRRELAKFLQKMHGALNQSDFHELLHHLGKDDRVGEELARANLTVDAAAFEAYDWDLVGACFFCFTAATTIGYGNYTPRTSFGKIFLVLYAIVAIPATLRAFADISDKALELMARRFRRRMIFRKRIEQAFDLFDSDRSGKLERREVKRAMDVLGYKADDSELGRELQQKFDGGFAACDPDHDNALDLGEFQQFVLTVAPDAAMKVEHVLSKGYVVVLALGIFAVFVLLSTVAFSAFYVAHESWSALDAFYFTIVTFTTIGFGDFHPDPHPPWFMAVFVAFTFFGLAITATLVRAASDPAFDASGTLRSLAPQQWDSVAAAGEQAKKRVAVTLHLPARFHPPEHSTNMLRRNSAVRLGGKLPARMSGKSSFQVMVESSDSSSASDHASSEESLHERGKQSGEGGNGGGGGGGRRGGGDAPGEIVPPLVEAAEQAPAEPPASEAVLSLEAPGADAVLRSSAPGAADGNDV